MLELFRIFKTFLSHKFDVNNAQPNILQNSDVEHTVEDN